MSEPICSTMAASLDCNSSILACSALTTELVTAASIKASTVAEALADAMARVKVSCHCFGACVVKRERAPGSVAASLACAAQATAGPSLRGVLTCARCKLGVFGLD